MTVLATMRNENFEVSRIEIDRPGVTYTIDTIEALKKMCRPDVRLYFITGADAIHQIMTWKESERLLGMCDFVAVTRPGYDKSKLFQDIGEIREKFSSRVHYMEVPALAISSSDIRERAKRGAPIKYLLPQEVEDYIHKFGLYQDDAEDEVKFMLPVETMQEKFAVCAFGQALYSYDGRGGGSSQAGGNLRYAAGPAEGARGRASA